LCRWRTTRCTRRACAIKNPLGQQECCHSSDRLLTQSLGARERRGPSVAASLGRRKLGVDSWIIICSHLLPLLTRPLSLLCIFAPGAHECYPFFERLWNRSPSGLPRPRACDDHLVRGRAGVFSFLNVCLFVLCVVKWSEKRKLWTVLSPTTQSRPM
jgi:hypothetical protein